MCVNGAYLREDLVERLQDELDKAALRVTVGGFFGEFPPD